MDINWQIIQGDCLKTLKELPKQHIQCCVTSPPYWGLRDYGVEGQLGLEKTPEEYVDKLVQIFQEVRRVLRKDGTLWLNLGDSYYNNNGGGSATMTTGNATAVKQLGRHNKAISHTTLKPKDLCMMPARVALALQADGWWVRSDIIWHKPNPMPESVTDRPTKAHEYIFLLTKSAKYFYDAEAVRESNITKERAREKQNGESAVDTKTRGFGSHCGTYSGGRNKRSVWTIPTQPFSEAHFAVFPPALVEPCILAGTSPQACEKCGSPWERIIEKTGHVNKREPAHVPGNSPTKADSTGWKPTTRATDKWQPTCTCENEGKGKCIVLDPFNGAGTTGMVALRHFRRYIGIELNPEYVVMSKNRITNDMPLFNSL